MLTVSIMWMFYIVAGLQLADMLSTIAVLKRGGREANPVMQWLFEKVGIVPSFVITKSTLIIALWFYINLPHASVTALYILTVTYGLVFINNLLVLRKLYVADKLSLHVAQKESI